MSATCLQKGVELVFVGLAMQQLLRRLLSRLQSLRQRRRKRSHHAISECTTYT
jgi:hypothetical protein